MKRGEGTKWLVLVIAGTLCLGMTGCGAKEEKGGETAEVKNPEEIKGSITVAGWPSGDDGLKAALDGFQERYPGIEVEFDFTDTTSHHQALSTSLSVGSGAADVAMVEGGFCGT